jgi:hypothetical protein
MLNNTTKFFEKKIFNLLVRVRQFFYREKTSYPFLSGDSFAQLCEVAVYGKRKVLPSEIIAAKTIFCPSERVEDLLENHGENISAKILVLGNTDRDFYDLACKFPASVEAVYLQNSHISDNFFHTLPIGIENIRYGRNGLTSLFDYPYSQQRKLNKILVGPFSPTHLEREELIAWSEVDNPRIHFLSQHLLPRKLARLASTFMFVACPRGNGTDTHRFWETLYRGSIPVVKETEWSRSIADLGVPLIQLKEWDFSEFSEITAKYKFESFDPRKIPVLWMTHWQEVFGLNTK